VQPWGNVSAPLGLPKNAATGRAYSGIILILWIACAERGFTGQNWLTFRQALKIAAHVRKGEKGTTVVYADRFIPYLSPTAAAIARKPCAAAGRGADPRDRSRHPHQRRSHQVPPPSAYFRSR
jgi:antirestriction protein ArdC